MDGLTCSSSLKKKSALSCGKLSSSVKIVAIPTGNASKRTVYVKLRLFFTGNISLKE